MKILSNLDLNLNQLLNALAQLLGNDPVSPSEGQFWHNTSDHKLKYYNGSSVVVLADETDITDLYTYVDNAIQGIDWKDSVRATTTGNIALSGTQTIDGISMIADDRVLVKDQTDTKENGIYLCKAGAWVRTDDANAGSEIWGAAVYVREGTTNGATSWVNSNTSSPTLGSSNITFSQLSGATVPDATTTTKGKVELATTAEVEAKTDPDRAVTPSGLVNFPIKFTANVGDNSNTTLAITHDLGTRDVSVQVYRSASPYDVILCDVEMTDANNIALKFAVAPGTNEYRVVIVG